MGAVLAKCADPEQDGTPSGPSSVMSWCCRRFSPVSLTARRAEAPADVAKTRPCRTHPAWDLGTFLNLSEPQCPRW